MPYLPQAPLPYQPQQGITQWPPWQRTVPNYPNRQWLPFAPGGGLLDQYPDVTPMQPLGAYGDQGQGISGGLLAPGMLQRIADILQFKRGVNPFTEMRDPGQGGGRGLLGSQWRDPKFIQRYEVQQGLKPGSLQPVPRAPASVTNIAPPGGRQFDFGKYNAKVTDPRMLTPGARATTAQTARPVRQMPEISDKLAIIRGWRQRGLMPPTLKLDANYPNFVTVKRGMQGFNSAFKGDAYSADIETLSPGWWKPVK